MMNSALAMTTSEIPWRHAVVLGLGASGFSSARYLAKQNITVEVQDSRERPPFRSALGDSCPEVAVRCGGFSSRCLDEADLLVVSPGISILEPIVQEAMAREIEVVGDIELFARVCPAPVVAITGSNGKTTVTTLVGKMLEAAGAVVRVGGNIGNPALDLLGDAAADIYVLELSSFQLETTRSLRPKASVILNVSADHMDRYSDLAAYARAKRRILDNAEVVVLNRDDPISGNFSVAEGTRRISFGLNAPATQDDYGILSDASGEWLACGGTKLAKVESLAMAGRHNVSNALAALALVASAGYPPDREILTALASFAGLPHRCEPVLEKEGILWINDSKSTNPGAAIAALSGMERPVVLIAGGQSKGADFESLANAIQRYARQVLLIGEDRMQLAAAIEDRVPVTLADDLAHAIRLAARWAQRGDAVLLSPACASFDMFKNFEDRGDTFRRLVEELIA